MECLSEVQLVEDAKRGEERAFEALYQKHRRWVYSLCLRMSRNSTEAEDLTQDAFLQLFRRISTFRSEASFSTWFHRLVINTALMHLRKKSLDGKRFEGRDREDRNSVDRDYGAEDRMLRSVLDRISIDRAMSQLPEHYRTVVLLHDVEGYRHEEIVRSGKGSVGTSKSQLHRARAMLRRLLTAEAARVIRTSTTASHAEAG
jgi:RNA polymerase sigma-70 factor, ECF subfamily